MKNLCCGQKALILGGIIGAFFLYKRKRAGVGSMKYVKLTTTSGYSWSTSVNGTKKEIEKYFLGKSFNIVPYNDEGIEKFEKVISVEFIN